MGMLSDYIDPGQTFVTCPNQDVVYGLGFFSLDEEPVVIQVPDFRDRFWVYAMYDARTDQFAEVGKPYNTKPGFYLIVGPQWKGEKPAGIEAIIRSCCLFAILSGEKTGACGGFGGYGKEMARRQITGPRCGETA